MSDEEFTLGRCIVCGKYTALKNKVCCNCPDSEGFMDFFKTIVK